MFKFWRRKIDKKIITKVRIDFALTADDVEHIVARYHGDISSKKEIKEVIKRFLRDNGWDFSYEYLSDDIDEAAEKCKQAQPIVKRYMPELYLA